MLVLEPIIQTGRGVPAVGHAHRSAADQVVVLVLEHVAGEAGPQQGDHRAGAVIGVDAGAADLHHAALQVAQAGDVELGLGVVVAHFAGGARREDAVGADDAPGVFVAHDEVLAEGVVEVAVNPRAARGQAGAHLVGEDPVAQLLGFQHFGLAGGEADVQVAAGALGALLLLLQHGENPRGVFAHCGNAALHGLEGGVTGI